MAKIISIHSFRGGTGKSNTTANLAVLVARGDKRVGVIDTDIHSPGIHVIFGLDPKRVHFALNDYLWGRCRIEQAAYEVTESAGDYLDSTAARQRVFLIPSSVKSGDIARVLSEGYEIGKLTDGFRDLIRVLDLDYLFIDTHPGVNEETLLSIALSDLLLLVLRPDNQDFQGTAVTLELARRLEVQDVMIVINKVPEGTDWEFLRIQVESVYQAKVAGMLPLSSEMAQLASSGVFAARYPNHPITQSLNQIAARVLACDS
jgi:MinD-like ATPase involved in chromosome partitioning or flagellar assembly